MSSTKRIFAGEDTEVIAEVTEENVRVSLPTPLPLQLTLSAVGILVLSLTGNAQRKPSQATRQFVVMSAQSLADLQKTLQPDNKIKIHAQPLRKKP
jgi:hypothetical protein